MKGFNLNIEKATLENSSFRKVLYTSRHCQLVLMSLKPKEEIGLEVHPDNDQFFRFEQGEGKCIIPRLTTEMVLSTRQNRKRKAMMKNLTEKRRNNLLGINYCVIIYKINKIQITKNYIKDTRYNQQDTNKLQN